MSHSNTAFHQLLKPLSRHEFVALSDGQENDMIEGRKFDFPKGSKAF